MSNFQPTNNQNIEANLVPIGININAASPRSVPIPGHFNLTQHFSRDKEGDKAIVTFYKDWIRHPEPYQMCQKLGCVVKFIRKKIFGEGGTNDKDFENLIEEVQNTPELHLDVMCDILPLTRKGIIHPEFWDQFAFTRRRGHDRLSKEWLAFDKTRISLALVCNVLEYPNFQHYIPEIIEYRGKYRPGGCISLMYGEWATRVNQAGGSSLLDRDSFNKILLDGLFVARYPGARFMLSRRFGFDREITSGLLAAMEKRLVQLKTLIDDGDTSFEVLRMRPFLEAFLNDDYENEEPTAPHSPSPVAVFPAMENALQAVGQFNFPLPNMGGSAMQSRMLLPRMTSPVGQKPGLAQLATMHHLMHGMGSGMVDLSTIIQSNALCDQPLRVENYIPVPSHDKGSAMPPGTSQIASVPGTDLRTQEKRGEPHKIGKEEDGMVHPGIMAPQAPATYPTPITPNMNPLMLHPMRQVDQSKASQMALYQGEVLYVPQLRPAQMQGSDNRTSDSASMKVPDNNEEPESSNKRRSEQQYTESPKRYKMGQNTQDLPPTYPASFVS